MLPFTKLQNTAECYFRMQGKDVFEFAINRGTQVVCELLAASGVEKAEIRHFISHQANINIIRELSARLDVAHERFFVNLDKYGNTASASVFIALDELLETGRTNCGDLIVVVAFGGGLSWGASLLRL
jgi:3-oxoacyl-[acyl-carrier-protein] synthase-3